MPRTSAMGMSASTTMRMSNLVPMYSALRMSEAGLEAISGQRSQSMAPRASTSTSSVPRKRRLRVRKNGGRNVFFIAAL